MSRSQKDLADRITKAFVVEEDVLAVLLSDLVAGEIDSENSNIDPTVFTQSILATLLRPTVVEGPRVGTERLIQFIGVCNKPELVHM